MPEGTFANGLTVHDRMLFVTDSFGGSGPNHQRRRPVTCGDAFDDWCPRGDLNPHALLGH
jgi:hypothetical protein